MNENTPNEHDRITRRGSLVRIGGLVASLGLGGWEAEKVLEPDDASAGTGPAAVASGLVACVLTPEQTEGPYFLEGDKVRRNVTEGRAGVPLALRLHVVDVSTCKAIKAAAVDIWHCDAAGIYSGVSQQDTVGQTFMRGIQKTDKTGLAVFQTIYPGWYSGRTVHIHVRVYLGGNILHTGQLYFPDSLTDAVYKRAPYSSRPGRETRNANDSVYRGGGSKSILKLAKSGSGYVGTLAMGVQRS
jgi:protocatechuate 3,4-dioxygenase beta subunit